MLAQLRSRRPSPAMVVALTALFVALGGSSYAAITLKNNSVSSKHIKNGQVKTADLAGGAVDASKVANGGLLAEDFASGQLPAGAQGPQGPQGPTGADGAKGADGTSGTDGADGADGTDGTDGADGAALTRQARCNPCPVSSAGGGAFVPIPLSNAAWTQAANEANLLSFEITWTPPAASCTGAPAGGIQVDIKLDGNIVATFQRLAGGGPFTEQVPSKYIFAPASATPHTLTAEVADNCSGTEDGSVSQLKVDVVSALG